MFEEEEQIFGHPCNPYHRFDCRRTAEHVEVRVGGVKVAETQRAIKLFEISIPPRYYTPRDDVMAGALVASDTRTYCLYKGEAVYYTVCAGDAVVSDRAWFLPQPLGEAGAVGDHVSFWGENTKVFADGRRRRPNRLVLAAMTPTPTEIVRVLSSARATILLAPLPRTRA